MKILIKYNLILCFFGIQSFAQNIPIYGTWDVVDYKMSIEVNCNCTAEEKLAITKDININLESQFDTLFLNSYLEFYEDNTAVGELGVDEVKGTYEQDKDTIILDLADIKHELQIIYKEDERFLQFSIAKSYLSGSEFSFEMDEIGKVEFRLTEMTLYLSNPFDEPYENHMEGEWE